jgi:hypothetical protein
MTAAKIPFTTATVVFDSCKLKHALCSNQKTLLLCLLVAGNWHFFASAPNNSLSQLL